MDQIRNEFFNGEIKTQNLETEIFTRAYGSDPKKVAEACRDAAELRCELLEKKSGKSLPLIKGTTLDNCTLVEGGTILSGIESKIGAAMIPMGYVGPAKIIGQYVSPDEEIYIPLATNEAALVAGVQRGLKAISLAGGIKTLVHFNGMSRAPLIEAPDIYAARKFIDEITDNPAFFAASNARRTWVKSNTPSSGSSDAQVDSAIRMTLIPAFFIISMSVSIRS